MTLGYILDDYRSNTVKDICGIDIKKPFDIDKVPAGVKDLVLAFDKYYKNIANKSDNVIISENAFKPSKKVIKEVIKHIPFYSDEPGRLALDENNQVTSPEDLYPKGFSSMGYKEKMAFYNTPPINLSTMVHIYTSGYDLRGTIDIYRNYLVLLNTGGFTLNHNLNIYPLNEGSILTFDSNFAYGIIKNVKHKRLILVEVCTTNIIPIAELVDRYKKFAKDMKLKVEEM